MNLAHYWNSRIMRDLFSPVPPLCQYSLGLAWAQEQVQKRERQAAIVDHRRFSTAADQCALCFASNKRLRHLTVAIGQGSYLALPARCAPCVPGTRVLTSSVRRRDGGLRLCPGVLILRQRTFLRRTLLSFWYRHQQHAWRL